MPAKKSGVTMMGRSGSFVLKCCPECGGDHAGRYELRIEINHCGRVMLCETKEGVKHFV